MFSNSKNALQHLSNESNMILDPFTQSTARLSSSIVHWPSRKVRHHHRYHHHRPGLAEQQKINVIHQQGYPHHNLVSSKRELNTEEREDTRVQSVNESNPKQSENTATVQVTADTAQFVLLVLKNPLEI